jgi:hypothetical protein
MFYKLTDADGRTRGNCQWDDGVRHSAADLTAAPEPCSPGVVHYYRDPLVAVFCDPIHGAYGLSALLWECEADEGPDSGTDGLKCWGRWVKTVRQVPLPKPTTEQWIAFGILAVMEICYEPTWVKWATDWLANKDRSPAANASANAALVVTAARAVASVAAYAANAQRDTRIDFVTLARKAMEY